MALNALWAREPQFPSSFRTRISLRPFPPITTDSTESFGPSSTTDTGFPDFPTSTSSTSSSTHSPTSSSRISTYLPIPIPTTSASSSLSSPTAPYLSQPVYSTAPQTTTPTPGPSSVPPSDPPPVVNHGLARHYIPLVVVLPIVVLLLLMASLVARRRRRQANENFQPMEEAIEKGPEDYGAGTTTSTTGSLLFAEVARPKYSHEEPDKSDPRHSTAPLRNSAFSASTAVPSYLPPLDFESNPTGDTITHTSPGGGRPNPAAINTAYFTGIDNMSVTDSGSPIRDEPPPPYYGSSMRNFSRRENGSRSSRRINSGGASVMTTNDTIRNSREQAPAENAATGRSDRLEVPPPLIRKGSSASVTSTLYSSDASIHDAEPRRLSHAETRPPRDRLSGIGVPDMPATPGRARLSTEKGPDV
ncbi:hypothetical protein K461DRAFT_324740 [Myriangium duriaei CBS 260.36]|uniref:Uncharacterized protein n=1 Tax=Myriangium duriaei CBS 260.36 TaxID=1168546 RepID=A0A9P4MC67_9PEZI|nr:hypothetical protein K461DRAFT_324740 [Myriangium duriaei CBS 260.36]